MDGKTPRLGSGPKKLAGWHEPSRDSDGLMRLPKGRRRSRKPVEELHEVVDGGETSDVQFGAVGGRATLETGEVLIGEEGVGDEDERVQSKSTERDSEAVIGSFDGAVEQSAEYDGDVDEGPEISEPNIAVIKAAYSAGEDVRTPVANADDVFDNEELLAGEERNTDDEESQNFGAPSQQAGAAVTQTGSQSTYTGGHQARTLREGTESIRPHPTDATKAIVTYRYTQPAGTIFVQETEMPIVVSASTTTSQQPGSIIVPEVEASKVPRTKKGSPWVPVPGTSHYEWTRTKGEQQETWRIVIFFRRLNRNTHQYEDMYINTNMLRNVDPNNKRFRTSYNKWVLQFARRRDATYTQKVARVHWSVAERRALYTATNTFCAKFGINKFGFTEDCKLSTKQLQLMADAVNAAPNPLRSAPRGVDAVRGQIISAHDKDQPKNKAIFDLLGRAVVLRARVAGGEAVPRAERKPQFAIALSEFPVDPPAGAARPSLLGGRKHKRTAIVEESDEGSSSSELSSPPASEVGGVEGVSEDTWMTTDEEIQPGESEEGNWSDTSEEVMAGDDEGEWEVEEIVSPPPTKRARTT